MITLIDPANKAKAILIIQLHNQLTMLKKDNQFFNKMVVTLPR